jgi:hypothetical protein
MNEPLGEMNEPLPEIEHGIPIPETRWRRLNSVSALIRKMKVGDSVIVNQRQRNAAFANAKSNKVKLLSRTQADGTVRIWRIK